MKLVSIEAVLILILLAVILYISIYGNTKKEYIPINIYRNPYRFMPHRRYRPHGRYIPGRDWISRFTPSVDGDWHVGPDGKFLPKSKGGIVPIQPL
tara:strand:+ start:201 stop:488 length:288 start_codon:yes stop_codon:yes gene_type:complete